MRFLVIVTGWNCQGYVNACYQSLISQRYGNFYAVFISDGSTDRTSKELARTLQDRRFTGHHYPDNIGAAKRRYDAIHRYGKQTDIVLLLGMDDQLLPNCLERIKQEYDAGKWMTYGNWINQHGEGLPKTFNLYFDQHTHDTRTYREVEYRSTAPNTFYKCLFDQIPESDFKINGKWIDSTTESEVMFSCLEMCGQQHIGVIEEKIYLYNQGLPTGTLKRQGKEYKYKLLNVIKSRPPKPLITTEQFKAMAVTKKVWEQRVTNLLERRSQGVKDSAKLESNIADYGRHLRASEKHGAGIGQTVIDLGCGDMNMAATLEKHSQYSGKKHSYIGVDAFPVSYEVIEAVAEKLPFEKHDCDTVICFAVLDGTQDPDKAVAEMCRVAKQNVLILTGIDIEPDQYHTHNIQDAWLHEQFAKHGFVCSLSNYLTEKVLLIEFKPEL